MRLVMAASLAKCDAQAPRRKGAPWPCASGPVRRHARPMVSPRLRSAPGSWCAGQACSGGSASREALDACGAGAILFSQQIGHSKCGCPCRPCSCSHARYTPPPTSSKFSPPPKGSPGSLGIRRSIAVYLPFEKAARSDDGMAACPFQCGTTMPMCARAEEKESTSIEAGAPGPGPWTWREACSDLLFFGGAALTWAGHGAARRSAH
jgi:hypothetical protein